MGDSRRHNRALPRSPSSTWRTVAAVHARSSMVPLQALQALQPLQKFLSPSPLRVTACFSLPALVLSSYSLSVTL
jgi:hypothetical protein